MISDEMLTEDGMISLVADDLRINPNDRLYAVIRQTINAGMNQS
jgi:hypothetical protein